MVFEEVGVLFEVDCFQSELAQSLATVGVGCGLGGDATSAEFGSCAVLRLLVFAALLCSTGCTYLIIHVGDSRAEAKIKSQGVEPDLGD